MLRSPAFLWRHATRDSSRTNIAATSAHRRSQAGEVSSIDTSTTDRHPAPPLRAVDAASHEQRDGCKKRAAPDSPGAEQPASGADGELESQRSPKRVKLGQTTSNEGEHTGEPAQPAVAAGPLDPRCVC